MFLATFFAIGLLGRLVQAPITVSQFGAAAPILQPDRLERTPRLDGVIRPEDWDFLCNVNLPSTTSKLPGASSVAPTPGGSQRLAQTTVFMNWIPGTVYFAAVIPSGTNLLISIDGKGKGFLIGSNSLELRIRPGSPTPIISRQLDATLRSGPGWRDVSGFVMASKLVTRPAASGTAVEVAVVDPGFGILPAQLGDRFGVRLDVIPDDAADSQPYEPRDTTVVRLANFSTQSLPVGLSVQVGPQGLRSTPGGTTTIPWSFLGADTLGVKSVEIGALGDLGDAVAFTRFPFPNFNDKGKVVLNFQSYIGLTAGEGYGVLNGAVHLAGGSTAFVNSSFYVAPGLELLTTPISAVVSASPQTLIGNVTIQSNRDRRLRGKFSFDLPPGWKVVDGNEKEFYIYDNGGHVNRSFSFIVPAGTKGTFPIVLHTSLQGVVTSQGSWVTIL